MPARQTVLVTGAAGFLGAALTTELLKRGRPVRAAVRTASVPPPGGEVVAVGDLSGATDWSQALAGVDAVVHCAARAHVLSETTADPLTEFRRVNLEATVALAEQAQRAGVRRFVFVSSIGVNGAATDERPFRADDRPAPHSPYAVSKLEAEQALTALAARGRMEVVIVRPPLILGPEPKGNLRTLGKVIARGLPLPFGALKNNRRDLVSLPVLCDLLIRCIDHPAAAGRVFLAGDGAPLSTRDLTIRLGRLVGRPARLLPVPPSWLRLALRLLGRREMAGQLLDNLEVDISDTRRILDWSPPAPALPPVSGMG